IDSPDPFPDFQIDLGRLDGHGIKLRELDPAPAVENWLLDIHTPGLCVCFPSNALDANEIGRAQSELQSPCNLVCRLLLEKKKKEQTIMTVIPPITSIKPLSTLSTPTTNIDFTLSISEMNTLTTYDFCAL